MVKMKADVHDYYSALNFLNGKDDRKLAHNTGVFLGHPSGGERGDFIGVYLHSTTIVEYWPDSRIKLYTNGYRTVTTKSRINQLLPPGWRVIQQDWEWYLCGPNDLKVEFTEGACIALNPYHD